MTGVSHAVIGTALTVSLISKLASNNSELLIATLIGTVASVLPDIDAQNSVLQVFINKNNSVFANYLVRKRERFSIIGGLVYSIMSVIELLLRAALVAAINAVKLFSKHRGFTHQFPGLLVFTFLALALSMLLSLPVLYATAFVIGYIAHIISDMMTVSGISFFSPFTNRRIYLLPARMRIKSSQLSLTEVALVFYFVVLSFLIYLI